MKILFSILILISMAGCASRLVVYESPSPGPEMASIRFKLSVFPPISVGQVFIYSGAACGQPRDNYKTLFRRARGNPLISDVNIDNDIVIPAGKTVGMRGLLMVGTSPLCLTGDANFTPLADASYFVRIRESAACPCMMEMFEDAEYQTPSKDFVPLVCPEPGRAGQ